MREILFKGKRVDDEGWVYGHYSCINHQHFILSGKQNERYNLGTGFSYSVDEKFDVLSETVCQYTGLTDKNGRKIFEGDIVKLPKCENDIAVFVLRGCNYFLKGKRSNYELGSCDSECFEVIGNIFDNPELTGDQP